MSSSLYCSEVAGVPTAVVAEWLRRLTRNQLGSARAGSNPADCALFDYALLLLLLKGASVDWALDAWKT